MLLLSGNCPGKRSGTSIKQKKKRAGEFCTLSLITAFMFLPLRPWPTITVPRASVSIPEHGTNTATLSKAPTPIRVKDRNLCFQGWGWHSGRDVRVQGSFQIALLPPGASYEHHQVVCVLLAGVGAQARKEDAAVLQVVSHIAGAAREVSHNRAAGHLTQNISYCLCRVAPSWPLLDPWKSIIPPTFDSALGTERNSLPGIF